MAQGLSTYTYPELGKRWKIILATDYSSIDSGTFVTTMASTVLLNFYFETSTGAVGDSINYTCFLPVGTYFAWPLGIMTTTRGIIQLSVDGVVLGTVDTYWSSTLVNRFFEYPSFTVTYPHIVTFNLYATGKNASSTDERMGFTFIYIARVSI